MADIDDAVIGTAALARLLGLTPQRVGQLVGAGILRRLGRGRFQVGPAVRAYIEFLRSQPSGDGASGPLVYSQERARLTKLQADMVEIELAKARSRMVSIDDVVIVLSEQCSTIRSLFMGLASRATPKVVGKDEKATHKILFDDTIEILRELTCDAEAAAKAAASRGNTATDKPAVVDDDEEPTK